MRHVVVGMQGVEVQPLDGMHKMPYMSLVLSVLDLV